MDPFTHGLVGAATAGVTSTKAPRAAACSGFVAALLADLDVFLTRSNDPLYQLEFHRQFSHSLVFIPIGALLAWALLWWPMRRWLGWKALYLACLSGYATAGLLDACTSYGTQLFWPFTDARIAWNLTPVVEPFFTLGLLGFLTVFFVRKQVRWLGLAAGWLALLLVHGAYRQSLALDSARALWKSRGHQVEEFVVKPTLGNQLLWRVTYVYDGLLYTDAIRTRFADSAIVFEGESAQLIEVDAEFAALKGTPLYDSLQRFGDLSGGYLIRHPGTPNVLGDARYAMLPTSLTPLWGLEYDPDKPNEPVRFLTFRDAGAEVRERYSKMLLTP